MAVKTAAAISTEIAAFFLDNVTGSITPTNARATFFDMNDSALNVAQSGVSTGSLVYWLGASSVATLPIGAAGQVLQPIAGLPAWTTSPIFGIPGTTVGRPILAGSGATSSLTLAAAAAGTSYTNTFPVNGGLADQILRTDGTGGTSWVTGGQILGDTTGVAASSGRVGQYLESFISDTSAVTFGSASTPSNVTSLALPAGDWDVSANIFTSRNGATLLTVEGGVNTISAAIPSRGSNASVLWNGTVAANLGLLAAVSTRFLFSTTTTVFLTAQTVFNGGTLGLFGGLSARRHR